jgi:hypothetical protein
MVESKVLSNSNHIGPSEKQSSRRPVVINQPVNWLVDWQISTVIIWHKSIWSPDPLRHNRITQHVPYGQHEPQRRRQNEVGPNRFSGRLFHGAIPADSVNSRSRLHDSSASPAATAGVVLIV